MSKYKIDLQILFLMCLTLFMYFIHLNNLICFVIYVALFIYFIIKKKPTSYFIIVILFSVMCQHDKTFFMNHYVLTTVLFGYLVIKNSIERYFVRGTLFIPLVLYFIYNVISLLWTPDKHMGLQGIIDLSEGYMMYYIVTNGRFKIMKNQLIDISKIATYIMFAVTLEIIYHYHLHGFQYVLHHKNLVDLGWGASNLLVVVLGILFPIALYKYIDKKHYFFGYFLLDCLNFLGVFLTLSRGAIVGLGVALLLYTIFFVRKHFIIRYGSIMVVLSFLVYKINPLRQDFLLLKDKFWTHDFTNDNNRFPLYKLAIQRFLHHPLLGDGIKSSPYEIFHHLNGRLNYHYHNFILQIAATLGIVGLLLLLYLGLGWLKILYQPKDAFVICGAISIIGALTHQMVDVSFDLFYFGLYFYFVIGIVEIYRNYQKNDSLKLKIFKKT